VVVLDSSAAVDYLARLAPSEWVAEQIELDPDLHAPHLIDIEVTATLRRLLQAGSITEGRARAALDDLAALDLARYPHLFLLDRVWQLRRNLTAADAAFVALAEALDAAVVTTDRKLAAAPGVRAQIVSP
jgi:predicted nucleic acid-binding protein